MNSLRLSRFMCFVLRHQPAEANITLDPYGWTPITDLLKGMIQVGYPINEATLREIVSSDDKGRYSIRGGLIRANHGHSVPITLDLPPSMPPSVLYHGTATKTLPSIRHQGIVAARRQFVHVSLEPDMATRVGSRHGKPVVLPIDAGRMHQAGYMFYQTASHIWLTDNVPADYIRWSELMFR